VLSLRQLRREGGGPVRIIDLKDGRKWRLPNLYFLARLLEIEPVVDQLVLTEVRGGIDGYLVGSCRPEDLRRRTEHRVSGYASAQRTLRLPVEPDLADIPQARKAAESFSELLNALLQPSALADDDPVRGYVTTERMRTIPAGTLGSVAVEAVSETLTDENVRAILRSPHRFVPATAASRVIDLIDREAVALSVARAALARA
jgi:hypothetical protein